jgi:hypothetical protein
MFCCSNDTLTALVEPAVVLNYRCIAPPMTQKQRALFGNPLNLTATVAV